jgi:16S rRNA G1207 methylase RsmC
MMDKHLYDRWGKLPLSLKTNRPVETAAEGDVSAGTMFDMAKSNQLIEQMQMFTHAMYGVSVGPAMALAKVFDFSSYNKLMDIGGGSGVYAIEVVKQNPNMSAVILELEPACRVADQYIKRFNLQDKIIHRYLISSKIIFQQIMMWHYYLILYIFLMRKKTRCC